MAMNLYRLNIEAYSVFLDHSGIIGNRIAAAYIAFIGDSKESYFKELEENGLMNGEELTEEGKNLADIICSPEKTIVVTNSSFGLVPLCFFCYKNNYWSLIKVDYSSRYVNLFGPIESSNIVEIVKDALIGEQNHIEYTPFSLTLNNDEIIIVNSLIMLIGNRLKEKNNPLVPHNYRFNLEDLFLNKDFAKLALICEVAGKSSEIIDILNDSNRIKEAINSLIIKQVLTKSSVEDCYEPSLTVFNFLAPQTNMFILSYSDISTKIGHKYYVFPNSIIEIIANRDSITFTSVNEFDYSVWQSNT